MLIIVITMMMMLAMMLGIMLILQLELLQKFSNLTLFYCSMFLWGYFCYCSFFGYLFVMVIDCVYVCMGYVNISVYNKNCLLFVNHHCTRELFLLTVTFFFHFLQCKVTNCTFNNIFNIFSYNAIKLFARKYRKNPF